MKNNNALHLFLTKKEKNINSLHTQKHALQKKKILSRKEKNNATTLIPHRKRKKQQHIIPHKKRKTLSLCRVPPSGKGNVSPSPARL